MATYYAYGNALGGSIQPTTRAHPVGRTTVTFNIIPVQYQIADVIVLAPIPIDTMGTQDLRGTWLHSVFLVVPALDSGTTFSFSLGDQTLSTSLLPAVNLGRAALGIVSSMDAGAAATGTTSGGVTLGAIPKRYAPANVDNDIRMTVTAAVGTLVATLPIKGFITYSLEEPI